MKFDHWEIRPPTSEEILSVDWKKITPQEGQIRIPEEMRTLARNVLSVMAEDPNGIAILSYKDHSDAFAVRQSLRSAIQKLSGGKVQTRVVYNLEAIDEGEKLGQIFDIKGARLFIRFRPEE